MKRHPSLAILTLAALVALGLPGSSLQAQKTGEAHPSATVPTPVHDFGKVQKGTKLSHDFEIRNTGDAPLEITRVTPDCGCTVAQYDRVIAPGESGKVHAEIDTSTLIGPTSRGITVLTNDPVNPLLNLTFKAEVIPALRANPGYARYQVVHGETKPGIIRQTLWAADGEDFEVVGVESPLPYLTTRFWKASEEERHDAPNADGVQWIVELNLDYNEAPVGPLAHFVDIRTTHPIQKVVQLPVSGFVRPAMWATPAEVDMGELEIEEPQVFSLVVQNFLAEEVEITEVVSGLEGLEAEVLPITEGRKFTVRCTLDPDDVPKGPFSTTLKIKTNTEKVPVLEVPIRGSIL